MSVVHCLDLNSDTKILNDNYRQNYVLFSTDNVSVNFLGVVLYCFHPTIILLTLSIIEIRVLRIAGYQWQIKAKTLSLHKFGLPV